MNTFDNCSHDKLRLIRLIRNNTNNEELKRKVTIYDYTMQELKIILNNLMKPQPCKFTRTKGVDTYPDLFR